MREDRIVLSICALFISLIPVVMIDYSFSRKTFIDNCHVESRQYKSPTSTSGTGFSSDGQMVTTSSYSPEEWILVVKDHNGNLIPARVTEQTWGIYKEGFPCVLYQRVGVCGRYGYFVE